jgi:phage-related protein
MAQEDQSRQIAELVWEGDSLDVVRAFPAEIRKELGEDIRRVQCGARPKDGRPMKSIGKGVAELRQRDDGGWYRTIYLSVVAGKLHILHSFVKKGAKTSPKDLSIAEARLKAVRARLLQEKKDATGRED